jgi:hypothetical protein
MVVFPTFGHGVRRGHVGAMHLTQLFGAYPGEGGEAMVGDIVGHRHHDARVGPAVFEDGEPQLRAGTFAGVQRPEHLIPDWPHAGDRRRTGAEVNNPV